MDSASKHQATVLVSKELIADMLFPRNTTILDVRVDQFMNVIEFLVQHPDLDPVPECCEPPRVNVVVTKAEEVKQWAR